MNSSSGVVSTEEFKDISKVLSQEDQKLIHKMHNEFDKVIIDKEKEISHLRYHDHKLFLQINKEKDKAQCNQKLEEENQDLQKKLLENIEENNHLKKRKRDLINHISKLRYDEKAQDEMLSMISIH